MKSRDAERLLRRCTGHLPGMVVHGRHAYATPLINVLHGLYIEDSSFSPTRFCVIAFFLPLYVPTSHFHFSFGHRLVDSTGCDIWWELQCPDVADSVSDAVRQQGWPSIAGIVTAADVARVLTDRAREGDLTSLEAVAYSRLMNREWDVAVAALQLLEQIADTAFAWQQQIAERARVLRSLLVSSPQSALDQLVTWERQTIDHLSLNIKTHSAH